MDMRKRSLSLLLMLCMMLSLASPAMAAEGDVVVLYTNDIHTYIANDADPEGEPGVSYSKLAALKDSLEGALLVDAGDHIQGTAYGVMDEGRTIIELMNAAGYDLATLGNHEFDYGMFGCMAAIDAADFPYVSCNFRHESEGEAGDRVLEPYIILEAAGKKIAFVGITTPESIAKSTPAYFQDEEGDFIYGIEGGEDGGELYAAVQSAIDGAIAEGADYVIGLGHLGVDPSSMPWTSREVIANTAGLDAFIDGHSHTVMEREEVADKSGGTVVLTQTGSYFGAVGMMTISAGGSIDTALLAPEDLAGLESDPEVKAIEDGWIAEIEGQLGQVIGYSEVTLDNFDSEGNRLVRKQGTNSGDFAADALYHYFDSMDMDVDAAIVNGGGIRNAAVSGELSYLTCKEIHTFGNVVCLLKVTGQQLLDALEWGASELAADGSVEAGRLLHVSGVKYTIDLSVPSTVQGDENDMWTGGPTGDYRVQDVRILDKESGEYRPIDLDAEYHLAGQNYILRNSGDGFTMFNDAVNVLDYAGEDYMALAEYIASFPVDGATGLPTITAGAGYSDANGDGRITIKGLAEPAPEEPAAGETSESAVEEPVAEEAAAEEPAAGSAEVSAPTPESGQTYQVEKGDCLWRLAERFYGNGALWDVIYEANLDSIENPDLIFIGQTLTIPAP